MRKIVQRRARGAQNSETTLRHFGSLIAVPLVLMRRYPYIGVHECAAYPLQPCRDRR